MLKLILLIFTIEGTEQMKGITIFERAQKSMNGNNKPWEYHIYYYIQKAFFVDLELRHKEKFHDADISRGMG